MSNGYMSDRIDAIEKRLDKIQQQLAIILMAQINKHRDPTDKRSIDEIYEELEKKVNEIRQQMKEESDENKRR